MGVSSGYPTQLVRPRAFLFWTLVYAIAGACKQKGEAAVSQGTTESEERALAAEGLRAFQGFKLLHLKAQIDEVLTLFGRSGFFEEYTKHDATHLQEMLQIYDWLLTPDTKNAMSPADWLLLVCATYLHDLGLIVTRSEFENRLNSNFGEYRDATLQAADSDSKDYKAYLDTLDDRDRDRFLYQEFVRANHAARIRSWLQDRPDPLLGYDPELGQQLKSIFASIEPVFVSDLGIVCESHHLDDLHDVSRYPASRPYGNSPKETANVQFAAIALRAADLLHITQDRTPAIAFRLINPANPYSQVEWAKQAAVRAIRPKMGINRDGELDPAAPKDTIEIHAEFAEEEGFFGLGSYITYAEKQLQQCNAWAAHSNQKLATRMRFPWRHIDTSNIKAHGFMAKQFQFTLDQPRILDLLTGHTLYNDSGVVVRELVQNSLDAVRLQAFMETCACRPRIKIRWSSNDNTLEVIDNGTGMTQEIIEQNFLRVGASRYQENSFKRSYPGFSPISRFGIGVLSTFMISDEVEVITCHSEDESAREISLRSVHGQYLVRLLDKTDERVPALVAEHGHGTSVRIRIRHSADLTDVASVLKRWIVVPRADVSFSADGGEEVQIGFARLEDAVLDVVKDVEAMEESLYGAPGREREPVEVRMVESDGMQLAFAVRWDRYFEEWGFFQQPSSDRREGRLNVNRLGISVEGVRVEAGCPGFADGLLLAMANVSGSRAPRTNVARTALEKTSELNEFLLQIYRSYCAHLRNEAQTIISGRHFSTTKAANEVQYLSSPIAATESSSRGRPTNPRLLRKAFREVPAFVKESGNSRELLSISEVEKLTEFVTLDSRMIRRVEYLLAELPGGITSTDIAKLGGNTEVETWEPDVPRLCVPRWGTFRDLLHNEWEPSGIDIDDRGVLKVKWVPRETSRGLVGKWRSVWELNVSPVVSNLMVRIFQGDRRLNTLDTLAEYEELLELNPREHARADSWGELARRWRNRLEWLLPLSAIPVSGLDGFDVVTIDSIEYLLPTSPLLTKDFHPDLSQADRLGVIGAVLPYLKEGVGRRMRPRRSIETILRGQDLSSIGSHADLVAIFSYPLRIYNVSDWERGREQNPFGM